MSDQIKNLAKGKVWGIVEKRFEEVMKLFDQPLDDNEDELAEQLTLAKQWDNPWALAAAVDSHPIWQARWNVLLRNQKWVLQKKEAEHAALEAKLYDMGEKMIIKYNLAKGLTANKSQPTNAQVQRWFILNIENHNPKSEVSEKYFSLFAKIKNELEEIQKRVDYLQIVVNAFKARGDLLGYSVSLLRTMIEREMVAKPIKLNPTGTVQRMNKLQS